MNKPRQTPIRKQIAAIVAAYVSHNAMPPEQLPALIDTVGNALSSLGVDDVPAVKLIPAVPIKHSVKADKIICLECGWSGSALKRHLASAHNASPHSYRARWGLLGNYPMVSQNYSAKRSELAKQIGLSSIGAEQRRVSTWRDVK